MKEKKILFSKKNEKEDAKIDYGFQLQIQIFFFCIYTDTHISMNLLCLLVVFFPTIPLVILSKSKIKKRKKRVENLNYTNAI